MSSSHHFKREANRVAKRYFDIPELNSHQLDAIAHALEKARHFLSHPFFVFVFFSFFFFSSFSVPLQVRSLQEAISFKKKKTKKGNEVK